MNIAKRPDRTKNLLRRNVIRLSIGAASAAAAITLVPFVGQILVHRKTTENGEIVDVDITNLPVGQLLTIDWLGKPVWIIHRSAEMIAQLNPSNTDNNSLTDPNSDNSKQPTYARNEFRSLKPNFFVAFSLCTHFGCTLSPRFKIGNKEGMPKNWTGGFLCPCHTSTFDFAGRAHKNREAKENLSIPPYRFLSEQMIRIGEDPTNFT